MKQELKQISLESLGRGAALELFSEEMRKVLEKAQATGNGNILLTERGTSFGYHNLVVDFRSFVIMRSFGQPVVFDVTHSVQTPGETPPNDLEMPPVAAGLG